MHAGYFAHYGHLALARCLHVGALKATTNRNGRLHKEGRESKLARPARHAGVLYLDDYRCVLHLFLHVCVSEAVYCGHF